MNSPTQFRFELDSWCYEYVAVELQAGELVCRLGDADARSAEPFTVRPTTEQWQDFWQAMERARVWEWQAEYETDRVSRSDAGLETPVGRAAL